MLPIKNYKPEKICLIFEEGGETPLRNGVILMKIAA